MLLLVIVSIIATRASLDSIETAAYRRAGEMLKLPTDNWKEPVGK